MDCIWSEYGELPEAAAAIRTEVFVHEQGFCNELDEIDSRSWHVLLRRGGRAIGTARIFFEEENDTIHIGRVAVLREERGGGSGSALLRACSEKARQLGAARLVLGAQCRAMDFYTKNGVQPFGGGYMDEGCPHQMMEKKL